MSLKWPLPVLYLLNQAKSLFLSFKSSSYPPEKKISLEICKRLDFFEKKNLPKMAPSDNLFTKRNEKLGLADAETWGSGAGCTN